MARWLWIERRLAKALASYDRPAGLLKELKLQLGAHWAVALGVTQDSDAPLDVPLVIGCAGQRSCCRSLQALDGREMPCRPGADEAGARRAARRILAGCGAAGLRPFTGSIRWRGWPKGGCAWSGNSLRRRRASVGQPTRRVRRRAVGRSPAAVSRRPHARAAAIAMASRHPVQRRIRAILQPGLNRLPVSPRTGKLLFAAALLLAVLADGLHPFVLPQVKAESEELAVARTKSSAIFAATKLETPGDTSKPRPAARLRKAAERPQPVQLLFRQPLFRAGRTFSMTSIRPSPCRQRKT